MHNADNFFCKERHIVKLSYMYVYDKYIKNNQKIYTKFSVFYIDANYKLYYSIFLLYRHLLEQVIFR